MHADYEGPKKLRTGFLAQDVEKIAEDLGYNFDGVFKPQHDKDHYSLAYSQFIMPLVKSVQEQQLILEDKQFQLDNKQKQIEELKKDNVDLKARLEKLEKLLVK